MSQAGGGAIRSTLTIVAVLCAMLGARGVLAHEGDGALLGVCTVTNLAGRATMTVRITNQTNESVNNVTPSDLLASGTGTATFFLQTSPRPMRELLRGKSVDFVWRGRLYGDGIIDLSVEVAGKFADGHSDSSGIINCNRLVVGSPVDPAPPTVTPADRPTRTPGQIDPTATPSRRATNTSRPTRTPRVNPTATATRPRPSSTPTQIRPTATYTRVPPTRTATQPRPTRTPIPERPTRTPIVARTKTPTPTRPPRPTSTIAPPRPTATPIPPRPTRTRVPTATSRPTRTPIGGSQGSATRTPTLSSVPAGSLVASCSLRRNIDFVTVTLAVTNRSGADLRDVSASPISIEPEGGALIFDRAGPSPGAVGLLRNGHTATFQYTGRLSPGGTMGFSASASANGPGGALRTGLIDCGVTGSDQANFDPASFSGTCAIRPGNAGKLTVEVRNGSREMLDNIEAALVTRSTTGTATMLDVRGPAPRNIRTLSPGARRELEFSARFLGSGTVTVTFEAKASRATQQRISTGAIDCSAEIGSGGGDLPDLGIDQEDLRQSVLIETQNFPPGHCAVYEGCVDGTGNRRLLRFNTTTPNYGPGDVFMGDPRNSTTFEYSSCHDHYHFREYADYRLLDMGGNIVARGHKQAFCLVDLWQPPGLRGRADPQFSHCGFQGISAGWADVYHRGLDCQWIDITGVPSGRYVLEVVVNPARVIREHNYANNVARTEVVIP